MKRRIRWFLWVAGLAARETPMAHEMKALRTRLQLRLTGSGGGDHALLFAGGRLRARAGTLAGPTTTVSLPAQLFLDLLAGRSHFVTAQLCGALTVEGEGHGALLVGALFEGLAAAARAPGLRGRIARFIREVM